MAIKTTLFFVILFVSLHLNAANLPKKVWIDSDAACGERLFRDVDDCIAITLLLANPKVEVVGISSIFGNVPQPVAQTSIEVLLNHVCGKRCPPLFPGAKMPGDDATAASAALRAALMDGPLTVFIFGPATNIASAIRNASLPAFHRFVAVAGTRGESARFRVNGLSPFTVRDLNFHNDPAAFAELLDQGIDLTLMPFELAAQVSIERKHIKAFAQHFPSLARQTHRWLWVWRAVFLRNGFFPFDAVATSILESGATLQCSNGRAELKRVKSALKSRQVLRVEFEGADSSITNVTYCHTIDPRFANTVANRLAAAGRVLSPGLSTQVSSP